MTQFMAMKVMELEIHGLPDLFDEMQLRRRAQAVISDLERLVEVDSLLLYEPPRVSRRPIGLS